MLCFEVCVPVCARELSAMGGISASGMRMASSTCRRVVAMMDQ